MNIKMLLVALLVVCLSICTGCSCEHDWIEADCMNAKTCSRCGEVEGEALGHTWTDATCTAPKTCSVCKVTEGEAIDHSFTNYVSNNDATCTEDGTKTAKCDRCDATDTIADEGSAIGHTFGATTEYKAATCLAAGNEAYKQCTACNLYFAENAATNANDGKSDTSSFVIAKKEHSYTGDIKSDGNGKDATHSFKCVNGCNLYGATTTHTWNDGAITTNASCLTEGVKIYTCTVEN